MNLLATSSQLAQSKNSDQFQQVLECFGNGLLPDFAKNRRWRRASSSQKFCPLVRSTSTSKEAQNGKHPGFFPFSTFPDLELSNSQKFAESENKIAKCEHTFSNRGSLFSSWRTLFSSRGNFVRDAKKKSACASKLWFLGRCSSSLRAEALVDFLRSVWKCLLFGDVSVTGFMTIFLFTANAFLFRYV